MKTIVLPGKEPVAEETADEDDFVRDAVSLFMGRMQGHMEKWEYGPSLFPNDPAGGSDHWADLVRHAGHYYLTQSDTEAILWATRQEEMIEAVASVETVIELGPGSYEAISRKTIPFLQICPRLEKYIAVDATQEQAVEAARVVQETLSVDTGVRSQDYMHFPLSTCDAGRCAVVMWGSSLGNIENSANTDPFPKLARTLENFRAGLKPGDFLILCFDTESDRKKILTAYSEPSLRAQILSVIHRLRRDGHATGRFDPHIWRYEPVWFGETGQCAHTIYPLFDQSIRISGRTIKIPAWKRIVSNNSYKFKPSLVCAAAKCAGLESVACLQYGPTALLVMQNRDAE
jgi:uncharacterized SAM-dependent methyltransferase